MEGYIDENRWVDLSHLPRKGSVIDWTNSIGFQIPFKYNNISGNINIVGRSNSNNAVMVTIDKYVTQPRKVYIGNIRNCELQKFINNKIADKRPDLVQYLDNPDDAYRLSVGSHESVGVHCPLCGYKTTMLVNTLSRQGLSCAVCGKGFSYPSKLMTQILLELKIPFIREASKKNVEFKWAENYRYDFYIQLHNKKFIIEMDGWFHQYNQKTDEIKDMLASNNGFDIIRIDCNYKYLTHRFEYIKNNILTSQLARLLPLRNVDFAKCNELALQESPVQIASLLWENEHKSVKEISEICYVNREVALRYLKIGKEIGLCPSYNPQESERRSHCKCVAVYSTEGSIINVFGSTVETSVLSESKLGIFISQPMVSYACINNGMAKGFKMSYISYEEYIYYSNILKEQYKIINNEVVLKEAI